MLLPRTGQLVTGEGQSCGPPPTLSSSPLLLLCLAHSTPHPRPPARPLQTSNALAKVEGPYSTYEGSPMSKGQFQFDMWGVKPSGERGAPTWNTDPAL